MKTNFYLLLLSLLTGALIGYGFYAWGTEPLLTFMGTGLCTLLLMLGMAFSIDGYPRSSIMMKTAAWTFFFVLLVLNVIFAATSAGQTLYVIMNGLVAVVAAGCIYLIARSKQ